MTEISHPSEPTDSSAPLRVQAPSKLAFGATTAALIGLASGGTAVLVARGTASMSHIGSLPQGRLLPDVPLGTGALVVTTPAAPAHAAADQDAEHALRQALAQRPAAAGSPLARTLTAPLVALNPPATTAPGVPSVPLVPVVPGVQLPPIPAGVPPAVHPPVPLPPTITPPAVTPPAVTPPAVTPPVVTPPAVARPVVTPPDHLPRVSLPVAVPPVAVPPVAVPPVAVPPVAVPVAVPPDLPPAVEPAPASSGGCDGEDREDGKGRGHKGKRHASGPAVIDLRDGVVGKVRGRWAPAGRHVR